MIASCKSKRERVLQGMDHLHLPTVDFFFAPKVEPMFRGVDYISKHVAAGAFCPTRVALLQLMHIVINHGVTITLARHPPPTPALLSQESVCALQGWQGPQRLSRVLLPHRFRQA